MTDHDLLVQTSTNVAVLMNSVKESNERLEKWQHEMHAIMSDHERTLRGHNGDPGMVAEVKTLKDAEAKRYWLWTTVIGVGIFQMWEWIKKWK